MKKQSGPQGGRWRTFRPVGTVKFDTDKGTN